MWHNLEDKNDSWDYVEKAINTALKMWITTTEWDIARIDGYSYGERAVNYKSIETMKRYLYKGCAIVWCLKWNSTTRSELTAGQLKTFIPVTKRTGGHAVALVGWDEGGLRFLNSWRTNDGKGYKSRFYVTYEDMIKLAWMFNWRYWSLYNKSQASKDPGYLKRKGNAKIALEALKKVYSEETPEIQKLIEQLSKWLRKSYPELNEELPVN